MKENVKCIYDYHTLSAGLLKRHQSCHIVTGKTKTVLLSNCIERRLHRGQTHKVSFGVARPGWHVRGTTLTELSSSRGADCHDSRVRVSNGITTVRPPRRPQLVTDLSQI